METYRDNDNSINYQDLYVNKEEDEICMEELQPVLIRNIVSMLLRQIKYLLYYWKIKKITHSDCEWMCMKVLMMSRQKQHVLFQVQIKTSKTKTD